MSDMMPSRWKLAPARSLEVIAYTAADLEYMTGIHKARGTSGGTNGRGRNG